MYSDPSTFRDFVSAITAGGGADGPEDIMGGYKVTFNNLDWRSDSCKVRYMAFPLLDAIKLLGNAIYYYCKPSHRF